MHAALEPYGLELGHAENGEIAVAKASATQWDLIFLDVVMPIMDGPTALREIRARGNTTPVVLVTSVSTATVVASALKLGGVNYIGKPFTPAQIRAVATKLLKLDAAVLDHPPRVLLQHTDPGLLTRLRKLLPNHVAIDSSQSLAQSLDIAESTPHGLVLIETRDLADEMTAIANVLRRSAPAAGIFAISSAASPGSLWQPEEGLDGTLSPALDDGLVRGFLYPNFLRPLLAIDGLVARISGFRGPSHHLPAYLQTVARSIADRWSRLDGTADLQIDLTRAPSDPDGVVALIHAINDALRQAGGAPSFRVSPAIQAAASERLSQIVIL
jgi:CheY-like chemotaxis protein